VERSGEVPGVDYARLKKTFERCTLNVDSIANEVSDGWAASYRAATAGDVELVEVDQGQLTYLFDIAHARVVGVYGRASAPTSDYPKTRMRGFPLPRSAKHMVRGHLAAHTLGGGTDINLVPQEASLNVSSAWRAFERWAQSRAGAFVAIEVIYADDSQTPAALVYLVADDDELRYERFENR
jgi:hypothetical protein